MSKMKKITVAVTMMSLLAFGVALAQMGSGDHDHGAAGNHEGTMQSGPMNDMERMASRHDLMNATFNKLDRSFQEMMAVSDMQTLRSQMVDHRILMSQMREQLDAQQNGWQQMTPYAHNTQAVTHDAKASGAGCSTNSQSGCGH